MELKRYFYKRKIEDTHSDYGLEAIGLEKCPIGKVKLIGFACTFHDCCKEHAPHMKIVEDIHSWIKCEPTTMAMEKDPSLGQRYTCVEN